MNQPYRTNPPMNAKKLPRTKARLRGLYRRIILPTKVVGGISLLAILGLSGFHGCIRNTTQDQAKQFSEQKHQEIDLKLKSQEGWAKALDEREKSLAKREQELKQKESEFNIRVTTFEDTKLLFLYNQKEKGQP